MTTYAIGDIQGCFDALERLLARIQFDNSRDVLWCTGDLVNRGPRSLDVLRFFKSLGNQHQIVLGNHDLHLLAVAYGTRSQHVSDTIDDILTAPDRDELLEWLRYRPLLVCDENYVMTHAGLAPFWDLQKAKAIAREVETTLRSHQAKEFIQHMYGNHPDKWSDDLQGVERFRCAVNYLTRMRFCYPDGRLDLTYKGDIKNKPQELIPWFDVKSRANRDLNIIFGHWAALNGKADVANVYPLDTGCVWGNCLTAMRLSDGVRVIVECK